MALASTMMACDNVVTCPPCPTSLRTRWLVLQKRNMMQAALNSALIVFTILATRAGSLTNCVKRLAVSMKKGAPGG